MPAPFLLDTNAYFLFFQRPLQRAFHHLEPKLISGGVTSFYISEITSMEIHSVLGKYRRGAPEQHQLCERMYIDASGTVQCPNTWLSPRRIKLKPKIFRDLRKLISDIEQGKGSIQASILSVDPNSIVKARELLLKYADRHNFGSHDALIAGNLIIAREMKGLNLTLVTSDKGLKAVLVEESIPFYDPSVP